MSTIERKRIEVISNKTVKLHSLPFNIQSNEATNVKDYFQVTQTENGTKEATFRGRLLVGKDISIPENTQGILLSENDEDSEAQYNVRGEFNTITVWYLNFERLVIFRNTDKPETQKSFLEKSFEYFDFCSVVCDLRCCN